MKLKISFDKKAIGRFFLEHTEKVVFGFFILVFATIIYGAVMKREKFDSTPQNLIEKCGKAQLSMKEGKSSPPPDPPDYNSKIAEFSGKINVAQYESNLAWDPYIFGVKVPRGKPKKLFNVQDLRVAADLGAFNVVAAPDGPSNPALPANRMGQAGGSGRVQGKCWVVLTGLVPLEEQAIVYKKVLRDAIAYDPYKDVPTYVGFYVERAEINSAADLANPNWNKNFNSKDAKIEFTKDWMQSQVDAEVVLKKFIDTVLTFPLGPLQNRGWGKSVAHEPEIPQKREAADTTEGEKSVQYKLFRFFDFSVESGKSYIYRIQLVLSNPNYKFPPNQLKDPNFAQEQTLKTEWSPTSKVIDVPNDTQIFAKSMRLKTGGDLLGKVVLMKWVKETGQQISKEFSAERGQVLNFKSDTQPGENTDFTTDTTVLDLDGGKRLSGKDRDLYEPGQMLLMFVRGKSMTLTTRNEMGDLSEVKQTTTEPAKPTAPGASADEKALRGIR